MVLRNRLLLAAWLFAVLTVLVAALVVLTPWSRESDARGVVNGDVDCNQTVDARDALGDLRETQDFEPPALCVSQAGDVNCDDSIDMADVVDVLRFAGLHLQPTAAAGDCPAIGAVITTPAPSPSPSHTATASPTPTGSTPPSSTATPTATPIATPQANGYDVTPLLSPDYLGQAADSVIEFALFPGRQNEALIATQKGYIYRVALDQSFQPQLWGDLHTEVAFDGAEQGLLSIAFSPDYQEDGRIYAYYTHIHPGPERLSRFSSTPAGGLELNSRETLLEIPHPVNDNHNGGHIVFGNDGDLYLSVGDGGGGGDPDNNAQDLTTWLGKILRIDVSGQSGYTIPPDNPFVDGPGGNKDEIYAYGFRNPFRFTSDPVSGDIWVGDVGQDQYEEVDKLVKGGNFGWDCREGTHAYPSNGDPACVSPPQFVEPRADYDHDSGQAVTGGVVYRGDDMPELHGWYVYADFYSGNIWALNTGDNSDPVQIAEVGINIPSFTLAADGEIYVVSYSDGIYKLTH
jgi:glucose/arabinose dehydrogenase